MTPQEFDKLVESLGGTTKAGIALGISAGVVSQYRTGKRTIGNKMRARIDALTSPKQEPLLCLKRKRGYLNGQPLEKTLQSLLVRQRHAGCAI